MQAWENFVTQLLPPNSRLYQISPEHMLFSNTSPDLTTFAKNHGYFAVKKALVGKVTKSRKDLDKVVELLEHVFNIYGASPYCPIITAEILTKILAFRNLQEGDHINIPVSSDDGHFILAPYRVDKVFNLWNSIPAFGLLPENNEKVAPILLFRGTQFSPFIKSGRASIIADLDPNGPGRALFEFSKQRLELWLKEVTTKRKARVMGYSLGGALAAYLLIEMPLYFTTHEHEGSYIFQCPGVSKELITEWEKIPSLERPAFESFIVSGDLVSKIGQLFGRATHLRIKRALPLVSAHTTLMFAQKVCHLNKIDLERENLSFYRNHYTMMHKSTSELFCKLGIKHLFPRVPAK